MFALSGGHSSDAKSMVSAAVRPLMQWPHDPGRAALRRASRAAIVVSTAFAITKAAVHDTQVTTFVAFGCFALIVMADFGGQRLPRARAYIGASLIGAALVTLGTLASPYPWLAALLMAIVGFCIQFAGVFGSYAVPAQPALLLAFVLAVSVPAPATALGGRLAGWCIAGVLATLSSTLLWPRFEHTALRQNAAAACQALAALVGAQRAMSVPAKVEKQAHEAIAAARQSYAATPLRPAGPARRDRAFAELLADLERLEDAVAGRLPTDLSGTHPCLPAGNVLTQAVVQVLQGSAKVLVGGPPPDLAALQEARLAHRQELDRWAAEALQAGTAPAEVLDELDVDEALRLVSYLALALGSNAVIASGGEVGQGLHLPAEVPLRAGAGGVVERVIDAISTHLAPTSNVLHSSLRTGLGLALAVLVSRLLALDHAFWAVLGTLSVLRSNALATGRTTIQALIGTVIGFAVSAVFMATVGTNMTILWLVLPLVIFLSAYAAGAIGFVSGQAGFTLYVIVLFNLIAPTGWRLGLVRIEDVAVGAAISAVVGVLLWPRGARGEARRAVAELYRGIAAYLAASFHHVLHHDRQVEAVTMRSRAVHAYNRAGQAFDQFLRERGAKPLDPQVAAALVVAGAQAIVGADLLNSLAAKGYQTDACAAEARVLYEQAHALVANFMDLADRLSGISKTAEAPVSDQVLREATLGVLRYWQEHPGDGRPAIAIVTIAEWIHLLGQIARGLDEPVAAAVATARVPWWR